MSERVAVVLSGAAARGAFQAGALAAVVPALVAQGLAPSIFLGTSAGAINAALWGSLADLGPSECGQEVANVWRSMDSSDVYAHPGRTLLLGDGPRFIAGMWGVGRGVPALLDTSPLVTTASAVLDTSALARNIHDGTVAAVGVTATRVPPTEPALSTHSSPDRARTSVFIDSATLPTAPIADPDRAVDVAPGVITREHVLASAAIPLGFPPVWVDRPAATRGWYVDGGVRLNAPLRPAVALGADRIVVIAAMATEYGPGLPPSEPGEPIPVMSEAAAMLLNTALADQMTQDIRTLLSRNRMVAQAAAGGATLTGSTGVDQRVIPVLTISPRPGALSTLAGTILARKLHQGPLSVWRESDAFAIDRLLRGMGDGPGRLELFSYLFFDQEYFAAQIALGAQAAQAALRAGWQTD